MNLKIRAAKKEDMPICENIAKTKELLLSDGTYMSKEYIAHYLNRNYFLVALLDGKIVGFIFGEKIKDSGSLVWAIAVSEKYRGHNAGTLLLNEYERRMKKVGIEWVILYGAHKNKNTMHFYKKNKYRSKGENTFIEFVKEF